MSDEQTLDFDQIEASLNQQEEAAWRALGYSDEQIEWFRAPRILDFSGGVYVRPCNRGLNLYKPDGNMVNLVDVIMDGIRERLPNFTDGDLQLAIDIRLLPNLPDEAAE